MAREKRPFSASAMRRLLILAQLMTLVVYAMGLQFLARTTGGTLFVFATLGPILVLVSTVFLAIAAVHRFRQRHSLFSVKTFTPGEYVFRQGEEADCAFFIRSGEVEVLRDVDGVATRLATLTQGQYFGEMALLNDEPRNADVRALEPTTVALLGKDNFLSLPSALPTTKADVMKTVGERALGA